MSLYGTSREIKIFPMPNFQSEIICIIHNDNPGGTCRDLAENSKFTTIYTHSLLNLNFSWQICAKLRCGQGQTESVPLLPAEEVLQGGHEEGGGAKRAGSH